MFLYFLLPLRNLKVTTMSHQREDALAISVINFFKDVIKENQSKGTPSRCLNLVNTLNLKGSPEMKSWFSNKYPNSNSLLFFYQNKKHFKYDTGIGIISVQEDDDDDSNIDSLDKIRERNLGAFLLKHCGDKIENITGVVTKVTKSTALCEIQITDDINEVRVYHVIGTRYSKSFVDGILPLDYRHHVKMGDKVKLNLRYNRQGVTVETVNYSIVWIINDIQTSSFTTGKGDGDGDGHERRRVPRMKRLANEASKVREVVKVPKFKPVEIESCKCGCNFLQMVKLPFKFYEQWAYLHKDEILELYLKRLMVRDIFNGKTKMDLLKQVVEHNSGPILLKNVIATLYYANNST